MKSSLLILFLISAPLFNSQIQAADEVKDTRMKNEKMQETNTKKAKGLGIGRKNCFMVNKTRERLCDKRAEEFCNAHKGAKECRRFINVDVSKP